MYIVYTIYIVRRYSIIIWCNNIEFDRPFKAHKQCIRALSGINKRENCSDLISKNK